MKKPFLLFFIFFLSAFNVYANQTNLSITPPPIVSPSFSEGKSDFKFGLSYLTVEDDGTIPNTTVDMTGAGLNLIGRKAFSDYFAGDFSVGVYSTSGDIKTPGLKTEQEAANVNLSFNLELQPFKTDIVSMIVFLGPTITAINGTTKTTGLINSSSSYSVSLYGMQVGVQMGVKAGPVEIIPFIMSSSMQGLSLIHI
ncbi:MAG: hypothetical protein N2999_04565, partial [Proteobacteria bacterium]|nr:hypothetical protein [Pseudomonadota bacterium]